MKLNFNLKMVENWTRKHTPEILTGVGIVGMTSAIVMGIRETPKAVKLLEEKKKTEKKEELKPVDYIQATWKCYAPVAVTAVLSAGCLIGANRVGAKRNAALATAATLSSRALREFEAKATEVVGEKKVTAIKDEIAKDAVEKNPVSNCQVIYTDKGNTLCYDAVTGQYFESDIESIRKAVNELNLQMLTEMYISLNEFYWALRASGASGLRQTEFGDELGWNIEDGLIDVGFSSQLSDNGKPCLVIDYRIAPKYDFTNLR